MADSSLRHVITKNILEKIHTGEFSSDTIITEAKICSTTNLSRTPVREALIELVTSGILEKVPNKGYKIHEFNEKAKINVYTILAVLDALAAKQAIHNMTETDFLSMSEIADLIDISIKYGNYSSYCDLQEKFHHIYINKCDNPPLIKTIEDIKASVPRYTYYSNDSSKLFEICALMNLEHRKIIELFRTKEVTTLEDYLINTHWITKDNDMI